MGCVRKNTYVSMVLPTPHIKQRCLLKICHFLTPRLFWGQFKPGLVFLLIKSSFILWSSNRGLGVGSFWAQKEVYRKFPQASGPPPHFPVLFLTTFFSALHPKVFWIATWRTDLPHSFGSVFPPTFPNDAAPSQPQRRHLRSFLFQTIPQNL